MMVNRVFWYLLVLLMLGLSLRTVQCNKPTAKQTNKLLHIFFILSLKPVAKRHRSTCPLTETQVRKEAGRGSYLCMEEGQTPDSMKWNQHFDQKLFMFCLQWQSKTIDYTGGGGGDKEKDFLLFSSLLLLLVKTPNKVYVSLFDSSSQSSKVKDHLVHLSTKTIHPKGQTVQCWEMSAVSDSKGLSL